MKKPIKEWGVVKFLKDKGLDIAQGVLTGNILGTAAKLITNSPELSEEEKDTNLTELYEFKTVQEQELTKRIETVQETERVQLQQEDLFTKRARPFRMYAWLVFLFVCIPIAFFVTGQVVPIDWEIYAGIFADMGIYSVNRSREKTGKTPIGLASLLNKKSQS